MWQTLLCMGYWPSLRSGLLIKGKVPFLCVLMEKFSAPSTTEKKRMSSWKQYEGIRTFGDLFWFNLDIISGLVITYGLSSFETLYSTISFCLLTMSVWTCCLPLIADRRVAPTNFEINVSCQWFELIERYMRIVRKYLLSIKNADVVLSNQELAGWLRWCKF